MKTIDEIRSAYCDHFIRTGELDQRLLAQLQAYADAHRDAKPDRRRSRSRDCAGRILPDADVARIASFVGKRAKRGRAPGSKFLIVNGRRKLVPKQEIENAIRNGACYSWGGVTQSPAPNPVEGSREGPAGLGVDDCCARDDATDAAAGV